MSDPNPSPSNPEAEPDLPDEAADAPESGWFFALFKSAMLYLAVVTAYLGAVTALVAAWKAFIASPGEKADLAIYAVAGLLALFVSSVMEDKSLPKRIRLSTAPAGSRTLDCTIQLRAVAAIRPSASA